MRGSPVKGLLMAFTVGIIPAHAGLTFCLGVLAQGLRDHPRACGAHSKIQSETYWQTGSSPRMRGSRLQLPGRHRRLGIIPAHAGLTSLWQDHRCLQGDHPRACGAHCTTILNSLCQQGSSPRMRGSLLYAIFIFDCAGIIPAHAGLTFTPKSITAVSGDHPRACGAHHVVRQRCRHRCGSSPRMRGSHSTRDE